MKSSKRRVVKDGANSFPRLRRALEVGPSLYLVGHGFSFFRANDKLLFAGKLLSGLRVAPQVDLGGDEQERDVWAEMFYLRDPLCLDVLQAVATVDGKTHEDYVSVGVGERPQTIVVLLTCVGRGRNEGRGRMKGEREREREGWGKEREREWKEEREGGGEGERGRERERERESKAYLFSSEKKPLQGLRTTSRKCTRTCTIHSKSTTYSMSL